MANAVVHFEVCAADEGPLVSFYREVFGWKMRRSPGGYYTMIDTCGGAGINGGIGKSQTGEPWSTFCVETDDPQATLDKANSLGGTTVVPVTDARGAATTAMFSDPDGLLVGLVRAASEPSRAHEQIPSAGSGEPVNWFEILGSDAARTQRFYRELFGWEVDDSFPGYATVDTGTGRGIQGGIGGGLRSRWAIVYALVADADQTLNRVEEFGGSRLIDQELSALKHAARTATYGSADDIETVAFRDRAGNVFGISCKRAR